MTWTCCATAGWHRLFAGVRAPSTFGTFLRCSPFGHVRQLDGDAARLLARLAAHSPVLPGADKLVIVDLDDTVRQTYGYAKQGAGRGYTGLKGLNALLAVVSTALSTPSSRPPDSDAGRPTPLAARRTCWPMRWPPRGGPARPGWSWYVPTRHGFAHRLAATCPRQWLGLGRGHPGPRHGHAGPLRRGAPASEPAAGGDQHGDADERDPQDVDRVRGRGRGRPIELPEEPLAEPATGAGRVTSRVQHPGENTLTVRLTHPAGEYAARSSRRARPAARGQRPGESLTRAWRRCA
jgi:hypothetical protein